MKKRLLITSALMTAVLGASLATGTYAWYNASALGAVSVTTYNGSVNSSTNTFKTGAVTVTLEVTGITAVDLVDNTGATHYYKNEDTGTRYDAVAAAPVGNFTITASSENTTADLIAAEGEYELTVKANNDQVRWSLSDTTPYDIPAYEDLTVTVLISDTGAVSMKTGENKVYYSILGQDEVETQVTVTVTISEAAA